MKQSNRRAVISGTVCLMVICFVVTLTVAGTRFIFKDKITAQEWQNTEQSMNRILKADSYENLSTDDEEKAYAALDRNGEILGYIFITEAYGYGSMISVMSGISAGEVMGIEILDCTNETPGLGQNVAEVSFKNQFSGLTSNPEVTKTEKKTADQVEAVTGATKSSVAVAEAVGIALSRYQEHVDSVVK
ncbi:FMN-binding protein [Enterococcus larvae]|uniref:FMN-binding protein n=1 Tax=Enterococcus larvae TaxID=2794352 RepID=UPI003F382E10